jgi:hypothetical protein
MAYKNLSIQPLPLTIVSGSVLYSVILYELYYVMPTDWYLG